MRNNIIDIAKGSGIILVVAGHSMEWPKNFIYLFHMPLFFFLSGYCYNREYSNNIYSIKILFIKRIKSLYFPFIKYGLIFWALHNFFYKINIYSYPEVWSHNKMTYFYTYQDWIRSFVGIITFSRLEQLLNTFWFLPALFCTTILFAIIVLFLKNELIRCNVIFMLFFLCCNIGISENKFLRILTIVSLALISFYMGFLMRMYVKNIIYNKYIFLLSLILLCANSLYGYINVSNFDFSSPGFYIVSSVSGIYFILYLSNNIKNSKCNKIFILLGKNTISIMALQYLAFKIVSAVIIFIYDMPWTYLSYPTLFYGTLWDIIYCIIGVIIPILISIISTILLNYVKRILKCFSI